MKKIIKISFLVLFVILACKKEKSDNPTNGKNTAAFNPNVSYGTLTDQDGNIYKTVTIGTQTWMAENLRTTKYRDDSDIPIITDNTDWNGLTTGAYCNYNNTTNADTIATFGRLYNWYAVNDSRKIAPAGWHVPTDADWTTLTTYLGGDAVAGGKTKESGTTHWTSPNKGATNESGFTCLPSGSRCNSVGMFDNLGYYGYYWSSTPYQYDANSALERGLAYSDSGYLWSISSVTCGVAVRLVKD